LKKLRILFVADVSIQRVIGGAERVLFEQSTRLAARGHRVHVITRRLPEHWTGRETIQGVQEIRCAFEPKGGLRSIAQTWLQARRHLVCLHEQVHVDCLNIHQPLTAFGLIDQAATLGIPRVYTCHSFSAEEYLSRHTECRPAGLVLRRINAAGRNWIEGRVLRRCNRIVALSRFTQEKLQRRHGIPGERVEIVPGGVDLARFHPAIDKAAVRKDLSISEDRFVLLTVRNLVPRMGLGRLVLAMQTVAAKIPQSLLVIGGHGPLREEMLTLINRLGLRNHVRMAGFIPEEMLARYYQMADLFVLPSLDLEGFGMVTLEALACGLPVLGTRVGGTREILTRWDARFLLSDGRPQTIAQGIIDCHRRLDARAGQAAGISRRCREFVGNHYSWDRNVAALESILTDARRPAREPRTILRAGAVRR
jgi:glycosyltransferase involved in cell wall biosynthesis